MPANMSRNSMLIGGGAVVGLISTFLPWYSTSSSYGGFSASASISGFSSWGILFFLAALVLVALVGLRNFAASVNLPAFPAQDWMISLILSAVMIVGAALFWLSAGGGASVNVPGFSAGPSFGLYLGLLAAIVAAVGSFMSKMDPQPATGAMNFGTPPASAPPPPPPAPPAPPAPPVS